MKSIFTVDDMRHRAKKHLPRILFDWIEGGAGDEAALKDNEDAISRVRFLPRYMIDVTQRSQSKPLFGRTYDSDRLAQNHCHARARQSLALV